MKETTLLQISQLGHSVLRRKTRHIKKFDDAFFQQLVDDMIATCIDVNGVGIAAPQVYKSLQLFIVASRKNPRYTDAPNMKPLSIANPKIISFSKTKTKGWEGCLSIPGIRGFVPRYESLTVSYLTRTGKKIKKTMKGFVARIFQHEYDHIKGMVFLDRLETNKDIISEKEYMKMMAKESKKTLSRSKN